MMDVAGLVEMLVKSIVNNPDMVSVKMFDNDENIMVEVIVDATDMSNIIGKGGSVISAINTVVQAATYINGMKKVHINIDSL
ncbi:MAG: KH domain-containing protein [Bacilli bacterium]|nr:KH domain-containing protein [Bacilli bacterium]